MWRPLSCGGPGQLPSLPSLKSVPEALLGKSVIDAKLPVRISAEFGFGKGVSWAFYKGHGYVSFGRRLGRYLRCSNGLMARITGTVWLARQWSWRCGSATVTSPSIRKTASPSAAVTSSASTSRATTRYRGLKRRVVTVTSTCKLQVQDSNGAAVASLGPPLSALLYVMCFRQ